MIKINFHKSWEKFAIQIQLEIEKLMNKFQMKLVTVIHKMHCLKRKKKYIHKINKARLLYDEDFTKTFMT